MEQCLTQFTYRSNILVAALPSRHLWGPVCIAPGLRVAILNVLSNIEFNVVACNNLWW